MSSVASPEHEKRLLRGVLIEALAAQDRKRTALEEQLARMDSNDFTDGDDEKAAKAREKALRRAELVPQRLAEVDAAEARLTELRSCLKQRGAEGRSRDAATGIPGPGGIRKGGDSALGVRG